ncbi:MAG: hypothetical protein CMF23_02150 [Ignavibacteriae bacterium]|nr:hypothetical protein [Ignavibacteriota bacterium]|tara:strand:- start:23 stop:406 length:384 start_codon:yes stop_codon:yes gene_type:complete
MLKQSISLLNFYFTFYKENLETTLELLESAEVNLEKVRQNKAKLLKKIEASEKLKQGEKFIQKLNNVLSQIAENKINIKELNISPEAQDDLQFAFNKFEGNAEEFNKEKLKEQTTLELIRKIKEGEI